VQPEPAKSHGKDAWRALPLALPLLVYLFLPTRNFYWDGVAFAIDIEKGLPAAALFHPSHLIYKLWGAWIYGACESLGLHIRALFAMQAANAIIGAGCVVLVHRRLCARGLATPESVAGALIFAFSATWWKFAADANAYVPSIFLLLCAYALLDERRPVVLAGLAHAGAMVFHELAILFLPVALYRLSADRRRAGLYAASALAPVGVAYVVAYRMAAHDPTPLGFLGWITAHAPDSGFSIQAVSDAWLSIRGSLRLFFGGKLSDFSGGAVSWIGLIALGAAAAALVVTLRRASRPRRTATVPRDLLLWTAIYVAFLFFWMPQNTFYRLFYLAPLVALGLEMFPNPGRWLGPFAAALALWNFTFLAWPQSRAAFNAPLRFALAQRAAWAPAAPILYHRFHPDLWTISYFNQQAAWIGIDNTDVAELDRWLDYAHREHQPLWIEADAYVMLAADLNGRQWLAKHERPEERVRFLDATHDFKFYVAR